MFDNLTMEIFYFSLIPVAILVLIDLLLLFLSKKQKENHYKYNYFIKILLILIISLVLPLVIGYTAWLIKRYYLSNNLLPNIGFIIILILLIIALIILFIYISKKLYNRIKAKKDQKKGVSA